MMSAESRRRDRLIALFILGALLFNPPLLTLFSGPEIGGWPLLYLYIFLVWSALIGAIALVVERRRGRRPELELED